jgi:hypothetical protein
MKKINASNISFLSVGFLSLALFATLAVPQKSDAAITSNLGVGSTGGDVTELQQFLSTNFSIYPEAIVSGYFGGLTRAAVTQYQVAFDIDQVGVVGPTTRASINWVMAKGFGLDTKAPIMSNLSVQTSSNGATISWSTSEIARGRVYYDTNPIVAYEATGHAQLPYISGLSSVDGNASFTQSVSLSGLQSNTQYYYITRSVDNSGNVTMTQAKTFRTN